MVPEESGDPSGVIPIVVLKDESIVKILLSYLSLDTYF